jgi:hypothetical protein
MSYRTTRVALSSPDIITPGSIVRLGDRLHKVVTPRILEDCLTREWVYDASLYGYADAKPVKVEFVSPPERK